MNLAALVTAVSATGAFPGTTVPARVTKVRMEELSFREQVELMAHSTVTIQAHGGGMVGA